jgi:hypothetical protein
MGSASELYSKLYYQIRFKRIWSVPSLWSEFHILFLYLQKKKKSALLLYQHNFTCVPKCTICAYLIYLFYWSIPWEAGYERHLGYLLCTLSWDRPLTRVHSRFDFQVGHSNLGTILATDQICFYIYYQNYSNKIWA